MDALQRQLYRSCSPAKVVKVEVQFRHVTMIVLSTEAEISGKNGSTRQSHVALAIRWMVGLCSMQCFSCIYNLYYTSLLCFALAL